MGHGNWNMLIDTVNHDPLLYFDCGHPLVFYRASLPPTLQHWPHAGPIYAGPIGQNRAGNLAVVLSHWDFDHWGFGGVRYEPPNVNPLRSLPWIVPHQAMGPAASTFFYSLPAANRRVHAGVHSTPLNGNPDAVLYCCVPPAHAAPAMIMNNSGLALHVTIDFGVPPVPRLVLLTGDANCTSLPGWPLGNINGMVAVHHGSNSHGAADAANLPAPAAPPGRIAYSNGLYRNNTMRPYNHPATPAVASYQHLQWTSQRSTAEGSNVRGPVPPGGAPRGNIRMGDQTALDARYAATAFAVFPQTLQLT
jgi:hypothetical protein